jgi:RNA 2',3'-cyclic 3'-phosphodiesterase
MIRTFIALELPKDELLKVIKTRDEIVGTDNKIRWEPIDKLHITLKFLGDAEEKQLELIKEELQNIMSGQNSISVRFSKYGVFKKGNDPKILWIGLEESAELNAIVEKIENSFTKFDYPKEERRFNPHITLLRFKGREDKDRILKIKDAIVPTYFFEANAIHLFKSELKPTGSIYTSLQKIILNKGRRKNEHG